MQKREAGERTQAKWTHRSLVGLGVDLIAGSVVIRPHVAVECRPLAERSRTSANSPPTKKLLTFDLFLAGTADSAAESAVLHMSRQGPAAQPQAASRSMKLKAAVRKQKTENTSDREPPRH